MTPTSQSSREGTPQIHVDGVEVPFFGDSSPSPPQMKRRRSRTVTLRDGIEEGDENSQSPNMESTGAAVREDHSYMSQVEIGGVALVDQEPARPLAKGRSSLPQPGSVRKPLPALPEDPS